MESAAVPMMEHPLVKTHRQVQRCLSAKLDNDSFRLLDINDIHHVFKCQRFEVQTIRSVVVRRDCLRVAVDHDRFKAGVPQGEGGMATA